MRPKGRPAAQQVAPAGRRKGAAAARGRVAARTDEAPRASCGAFNARGLSQARADALRAQAHAVLDAQLRERLGKLSDRSQVSIDELEETVCACTRQVGESLLGGLLQPDAWRTSLEGAESWPCPDCGHAARRLRSPEDKPLDEETTLQTRTGPVPWHAPVFHCRRCRRRFSPR